MLAIFVEIILAASNCIKPKFFLRKFKVLCSDFEKKIMNVNLWGQIFYQSLITADMTKLYTQCDLVFI